VWNITRPKKDSGLKADQRVISIGKSRIGRSGEQLLQTQNVDLTVTLVEAKRPEELQTRAGTVGERILNRLQTADQPMTRPELVADPLINGGTAAVRKTLQRLVNRGVVRVVERTKSKQGKPTQYYEIVRAYGESQGVSQEEEIPSAGTEDKWDTSTQEEECPIKESSAGALSDDVGTEGDNPHARDESFDRWKL
jgi:hypothetical protein